MLCNSGTRTCIITIWLTLSSCNGILYFKLSLIKWKILNTITNSAIHIIYKNVWKFLWMSSALEPLTSPICFKYIQGVNSGGWKQTVYTSPNTGWGWLVPQRPRKDGEDPIIQRARELWRQREQNRVKVGRLWHPEDWKGSTQSCNKAGRGWGRGWPQ